MPPLGPPLVITTKQDLPASTMHADPAGTIKIGLNESTALLFGFVMLLIGAVLWSVRAPNTENADFSITYVGAKIVHDGHGAALYDLREQAKVKNSLYARPQPLIYEHPPFEAL